MRMILQETRGGRYASRSYQRHTKVAETARRSLREKDRQKFDLFVGASRDWREALGPSIATAGGCSTSHALTARGSFNRISSASRSSNHPSS
jgi:hypothetical protein